VSSSLKLSGFGLECGKPNKKKAGKLDLMIKNWFNFWYQEYRSYSILQRKQRKRKLFVLFSILLLF